MTPRRAYEGRHPVTWLDFASAVVIVAVLVFALGAAVRYVATRRLAPIVAAP